MIAHRQLLSGAWKGAIVPLILALAPAALADPANTLTLRTELPSAGLSAIRTLAALVIVLSLFFGGVWLYRNSQRLAWRKSGLPKLAILESRPLGNRYALYVVGYEQQRLLIGSSPAGLSLLSQLPAATAAPQEAVAAPLEPASFAQCLQQLLKGRRGSRTEGTGS
jgi:flagellar biogenesis protein FliO